MPKPEEQHEKKPKRPADPNSAAAAEKLTQRLQTKVEIKRRGHVRRAKLYYLRDLAGKKARIKERRV